MSSQRRGMSKRSKFVKPAHREILRGQVLASKRISTSFVRVTIGGADLNSFTPMGYDQWFRLFLPGKNGLRLPTTAGNLWFAQYMMMGKDSRPLVRNYTVRNFRSAGAGEFGDTAELDIDFLVHDDTSPAALWAIGATPGDEIGILDEGITYQATGSESRVLIVADDSGLPAVAGILRSAPSDLVADVVVEIEADDDRQELGAPAGVTVTWVQRAPGATPGARALEHVTSAPPAAGTGYAFLAGEQKLVAGARRHLVQHGIAKSDITFTGYWREGKAAGEF